MLGVPSLFCKQFFLFNVDCGGTVQLLFDGNFSEHIEVHNGHDQGSPESQSIFCVELSPKLTLLDQLRSGVEILGKRRSVKGFFDNTSIWVSSPADFDIIESVCRKVKRVLWVSHCTMTNQKRKIYSFLLVDTIKFVRSWPPWIED